MSSRVYVGNLPPDCREREVEDLFYKVSFDHGGICPECAWRHLAHQAMSFFLIHVCLYLSQYGRIVSIDLKLPPRPPAFAFVQFEDARDAEEAVRGRDGYDFHGSRLRVRGPLAVCFS